MPAGRRASRERERERDLERERERERDLERLAAPPGERERLARREGRDGVADLLDLLVVLRLDMICSSTTRDEEMKAGEWNGIDSKLQLNAIRRHVTCNGSL